MAPSFSPLLLSGSATSTLTTITENLPLGSDAQEKACGEQTSRQQPQTTANIGHELSADRMLYLNSSNNLVVVQSCPTLYDPMDCSMPGFPVLHHLLEFPQINVHCISDAIQPSLLSPSLPAFNLSQHIRVFFNESAIRIR